MSDLHLEWAGDLSPSVTGDLVVVSLPKSGTERVIRRLMTSPGAYVWHPEYGAGLASFVGQPIDAASIEAVIRSQMLLEPAVASQPEPVVIVSADTDGTLFVQVRYADADTAEFKSIDMRVSG